MSSGGRGPVRWPWEKDPTDREANYRRPVRVAERARLTIKVAAVVAAFFWIKVVTADRSDVGAEFLIGVGAPLAIAGVVDLVWTMRGQLDHVFIDDERLQIAVHGAVAVAGVVMMVVGAVIHR